MGVGATEEVATEVATTEMATEEVATEVATTERATEEMATEVVATAGWATGLGATGAIGARIDAGF